MNGDETLRTALERFVADPESPAATGALAGLDPDVLGEAVYRFAGAAPVELARLLEPLFDSFDLFGGGDGAEVTLDDVSAALMTGPTDDLATDVTDGFDDAAPDPDEPDGRPDGVEDDPPDRNDAADDGAEDDDVDDTWSDDGALDGDTGAVSGSIFGDLFDAHEVNSEQPLFFESASDDTDNLGGGHSGWFEESVDDDPASDGPGSVYGDDAATDDLDDFDVDTSSLFDGE